MTLPLSGTLEASDINVELGRSATATFSITDAATGVYATINTCSPYYPNSSAPHAYSEWYGYNHNAPCLNSNFSYWDDPSTTTDNMLYSASNTYSTQVSSTRPNPASNMSISFWMKQFNDGVTAGYIFGLWETTGDSMSIEWGTNYDSGSSSWSNYLKFSFANSGGGFVNSTVNLSDATNGGITGVSSSNIWSTTNQGNVDTNGYSLITITVDYSDFGSDPYIQWYWNGDVLEVPWTNSAGTYDSHTYGDSISTPTWTTGHQLAVGGFNVNQISSKCRLDAFAIYIDTTLTDANVVTLYNGGAVASLSDYQNISTQLLFYNFEITNPNMGDETGGTFAFDLDEYNSPKRVNDPAV